jgi:hypothetical protein
VLSALFGLKSKDAMRMSFCFERSCPEQRLRDALKPQEPRSSGPWTPGANRGVGVLVVESWQVWQAAGAIFVVGKAVLTLHPPLRPLSHNVNSRDGAQDIHVNLMNDYPSQRINERVCMHFIRELYHGPSARRQA